MGFVYFARGIRMTQLTLNQKNSILSVAHEHLYHPSSIDHAITSISSAVQLESDLVKTYLSSLYDLDALVAARVGQKADDEVPESPSKRIKSSPLKYTIRTIEPAEPSAQQFELPPALQKSNDQIDGDEEVNEDEEQDKFEDEMMEDQPEEEQDEDQDQEDEAEEEPEEEPEEPKRSSRSRRSSSAAVLPEVLVTPVKRPRRR